MDRKAIGPEAIALACSVIGQCKADTATARRTLAQAHAWTCSPAIDPTWKAPVQEVEPVQLSTMQDCIDKATDRAVKAEQEIADLTAKLVKLGALVTSKDQEIAKLRKQTEDDTEHQIIGRLHATIDDAHEAMSKLDGFTRERAESVLADRITRYARKHASQAAPVAKPAPVVPAKASEAPAPRSVAPDPLRQIRPDAVKAEEWATMPPSTRADAIKSSVADPYADLPPNLREWARKRDAARNPSSLEID